MALVYLLNTKPVKQKLAYQDKLCIRKCNAQNSILLADPDSHFPLQKPIYIIGDAGLKTQDAEDSLSSAIQSLEASVLSLGS
jgi:hypothetical protein